MKRATFRADELVLARDPHHRWRCPGCAADLQLDAGDPRASARKAPRCARCGAWMAPVNPDRITRYRS